MEAAVTSHFDSTEPHAFVQRRPCRSLCDGTKAVGCNQRRFRNGSDAQCSLCNFDLLARRADTRTSSDERALF
jgi:hypothetical protein